MKLEVRNLHKSFGSKEVLHGISFAVESGSALGLLGRNGAGKTTTIRILMDVFKSDQGSVLLDGQPFSPKKHSIGYLPEERGLYPKKTVNEQLIYLGQLRGLSAREAREKTAKWLARLEVSEYAERKLETLSKGNQQKVQLAQTLLCDPDIVILDEPFSGLDPVNSQILKDVIREQITEGKLVVFSSHQMSYVEEFCQDIVIINHGDVVLSGDLAEIKRQYGKNRLFLAAANRDPKELAELVERELEDLVTVYQTGKRGVVLQLLPGKDKKMVLSALAGMDFDLESFGNYEPSLTDIFVERAGDEA